MIKKRPLILSRINFLRLCLLFLMALGGSVSVRADIFLKPNSGPEQEDSKPSGKVPLFVPLKPKTFEQAPEEKKVWSAYKPKSTVPKKNDTQALKSYAHVEDTKMRSVKVDPELLNPGGREPRNLQELQASAFALKSLNVRATQELRQMNAKVAAHKMKAYEQRVAQSQTEPTQGQNQKASAQQKKQQFIRPVSAPRYTTIGIPKPQKVFDNYP